MSRRDLLLDSGERTRVIPHAMHDVLTTKKAPQLRGAVFFHFLKKER